MRSPAEFEADHATGDSDGLARAGRCAGARKDCAQPTVAHSYHDNNSVTPRNRGGPSHDVGPHELPIGPRSTIVDIAMRQKRRRGTTCAGDEQQGARRELDVLLLPGSTRSRVSGPTASNA